MWQYKCEQCGKVIEKREDIRLIKIEDENSKPKISPIQSCVFCIVELREHLNKMVAV
ncbi:hypothetical protein LCGC14_2927490 [marine sediment metagenome]|uniref:Uncharacterized protein n=1 Tax=marine sediment metagenome TaxID=412755 RepID=A0A0F8ZUK8_9ZZZZ